MSVEMKVPPVGESITEIVLSQWIKNDGDYVEMDEVIAEMESDKATFELTAEKGGILKTKVSEGDTVPVGDVICVIEEGEAPAEKEENSENEEAPADKKEESKTDKAPAEEKAKTGGYADGHPSPAAAKTLAEKGVDAKDVKGTGKDGRITKEDALKAEKASAKPFEAKEAEAKAPVAAPVLAGSRNERRERMPNLRKTIARRLVNVQNETAMLTTFNEADMAPIMKLRAKYKEQFKEKYGVGLGFMSFFTKACCQALKEFPDVNGRIDGEEIVYNDYVDVSIAVSTPRGLVVPVIRNAESMSLDQIEAEIVSLATKARDGKLTIEEMTGGTFTITNGGVFGSMMSTPIINAPQSAILGMHNIVERPIAVNGEVVVKPMMYLALSYDHRIIDGKQSVSFLVRVKQLLEDPARLLIGV